MPIANEFLSHLASGHTTICKAWLVRRKDGQVFGFTDHDNDLTFDGVVFLAGSGLTANALTQSTGLSVDNTEASGVLSADSVTEIDLKSGRFDGAEIFAWMVNWTDVSQRALQFQGSIGEVKLESGQFSAELRGLSEALNQTQGLVYQRGCTATLGDKRCGLDLSGSDYSIVVPVSEVNSAVRFGFSGLGFYAARWFEQGRFEVQDGAAAGLSGHIKADRDEGGLRRITLWSELRADLAAGDSVRLVAGCDRRRETCRVKFANFLNFRGFPHIPGEDWLVAYPSQNGGNNGGSRYK